MTWDFPLGTNPIMLPQIIHPARVGLLTIHMSIVGSDVSKYRLGECSLSISSDLIEHVRLGDLDISCTLLAAGSTL
jgi:hypothetical protein